MNPPTWPAAAPSCSRTRNSAWPGWAARKKDNTVTPLFIAVKDPAAQHECQLLVHRLALEPEGVSPAARALATDRHVVCNDLADEANPVTLRRIAAASGGRSCISWPLIHDRQKYGVLTVQSSRAGAFADAADLDFIANVATAIARALHLWHTSTHLRLEHDFNCEIVQTVQAPLVSLPCGQILSFNPTAEEVTGYREHEVRDRYCGRAHRPGEPHRQPERVFPVRSATATRILWLNVVYEFMTTKLTMIICVY